MKLWICGHFRQRILEGVIWDIQGVFSTEEAAVEACINPEYFVAPLDIDKALPEDMEDWPGCYYPLRPQE